MTVFAVQEPCSYKNGQWVPRVNIYTAEPYGEVRKLVKASHVHAALLPQPTIRALRRDLKDFSDDDYLLPVGDVSLVAMATAVALENNRGRAKLLRWNREERRYDVVVIDMYGNKSGDEA